MKRIGTVAGAVVATLLAVVSCGDDADPAPNQAQGGEREGGAGPASSGGSRSGGGAGTNAGGKAQGGLGGLLSVAGEASGGATGGSAGEAPHAGGAVHAGGGEGGAHTAAGAGGDGAAAVAGAGGNGGAPGEVCEYESSAPQQTPSCAPDNDPDDGNACRECMKAECCQDWQACYGEQPRSACGYGGPGDEIGQFDCITLCFYSGYPTATDDAELLTACASSCAGNCDSVAEATSALVACAVDECAHHCFPLN
jgi:hypothetical protein